MQIDQEWVVENIDLMMKEFLTVHPQFKKNDNTSMAGRSQHKKAMMRNCDTLTYRPIYYIVKTVTETRTNLNNKVKKFWNDSEDSLVRVLIIHYHHHHRIHGLWASTRSARRSFT